MTAPLSPSDLAEIEAVAKAATPGPWVVVSGVDHSNYDRPEPYRWVDFGQTDSADSNLPEYLAAHIARMDPATTLALLAWGKRAEDAVARVRELCEPTATATCGCEVCSASRSLAAHILAALDVDAAAGGAG